MKPALWILSHAGVGLLYWATCSLPSSLQAVQKGLAWAFLCLSCNPQTQETLVIQCMPWWSLSRGETCRWVLKELVIVGWPQGGVHNPLTSWPSSLSSSLWLHLGLTSCEKTYLVYHTHAVLFSLSVWDKWGTWASNGHGAPRPIISYEWWDSSQCIWWENLKFLSFYSKTLWYSEWHCGLGVRLHYDFMGAFCVTLCIVEL